MNHHRLWYIIWFHIGRKNTTLKESRKLRLMIHDDTDGGGNFSCHDKNSQTDDNDDDNDDEIPQTCGVVECSSIRKRSCQKIICLPHFNHSH